MGKRSAVEIPKTECYQNTASYKSLKTERLKIYGTRRRIDNPVEHP